MNTHSPENNTHLPGNAVMDAIHKGRIHMRPRWHFILLSALTVLGALIVFLTLLYAVSLAVFFLRDSGQLFAPAFGARGWWTLLRSVPWLLVLLCTVFIVVLEILVCRYRFIYGRPLFASVLGILVVIALGGFAISQTNFHRYLARDARGTRTSPLEFLYHGPLRMPRPDDSYHGKILEVTPQGFVMVDEDDAGTTTVLTTQDTRFPNGENFSPGERVIVVGDNDETGVVRAFGVHDIDD